jgi:hypothetical protein
MSVWRAAGVVAWVVLTPTGVVISAVAWRCAARLLLRTEPVPDGQPASRRDQLTQSFLSRVRTWAGVFLAALLGAAVSDYNQDAEHGLARLAGLFLLVVAVLVLVAGISLGNAAARAAKDDDDHDQTDLRVGCWMGGALAFVGLFWLAATLLNG